jgi:hypothetical protein
MDDATFAKIQAEMMERKNGSASSSKPSSSTKPKKGKK